MKFEGIPFIDHLPVLEAESETVRQSEAEVVHRTIALAIVSAKAGLGRSLALRLVHEFGSLGFFTPTERSFLQARWPNRQDLVRFSWRYECVNLLLWALQIFEDLPKPYEVADVDWIAETLKGLGTDGMLKRAKLRAQSELLDECDLAYRYHWAVVDARLHGRPAPNGLNSGVVEERHHALNWLIGYCDNADWDSVSTNT